MSSPRQSVLVAIELALLVSACEPTVYVARRDPCAGGPAEWAFCAGFEDGDFSAWNDFDGNPPSMNEIVDDAGPDGMAGNHVARLIPPPGPTTAGADLVAELPPMTGPVFARWYAYWEPGFDFTIGTRGSGLHAGLRDYLGTSIRPDGTDFFDALIANNAGGTAEMHAFYPAMYQDCPDDESCVSDKLPCMSGGSFCTRPADLPTGPGIPFVTGRWTCIEIEIDPGTPTPSETGANGVYEAWIDGVSVGAFPNRWLRSTADLVPSVLWIGLYFVTDHPSAAMRIDDVVVSSARIGC